MTVPNLKARPASVPTAIFADWREVLNQSELGQPTQAGYSLAIAGYLDYCRRANGLSITTQSAREWGQAWASLYSDPLLVPAWSSVQIANSGQFSPVQSGMPTNKTLKSSLSTKLLPDNPRIFLEPIPLLNRGLYLEGNIPPARPTHARRALTIPTTKPMYLAYSQMIDLLCRLNREITLLQKQRDDSSRTLGPAYHPVRIKNDHKTAAIDAQRTPDYRNPSVGYGSLR